MQKMDGMGCPPRVVIVGGGFAGLECAKALASAPCDVTLIDKQNHHCFQPLLYQVATAALSPADIAWPIRGILSGQKNVRVVMGQVEKIDRESRQVITLDALSYPFEFLVVATGAAHSYFMHPEWAHFAPGLKRLEDALEIRRRILLSFEHAETEPEDAKRSRLMTFVVIGGGPTGVELAGAIAETARFALSRDFRRIDPRTAKIILLEAGPRVLPGFPPALSAYAQRALRNMGVDVRTETAVIGMNAKAVETSNGTLEVGCVLWAAGVRPSAAAEWLNAKADRNGRIVVEPDLSIPGDSGIFVIGDTAIVHDARGKPVPGIAPAAKQMGKYVAGLIKRRLSGKNPPKAFQYWHAGDLATIGRKAAIVSLGRLQFTGFAGWIFWSVAHIYYLISARNRTIVALEWIWDYITFQRGARLINGDNSRLDGT